MAANDFLSVPPCRQSAGLEKNVQFSYELRGL